MRLIRNEFGQLVPDKPTYSELESAFRLACHHLSVERNGRVGTNELMAQILGIVMKPVTVESDFENQIDINEILGGKDGN